MSIEQLLYFFMNGPVVYKLSNCEKMIHILEEEFQAKFITYSIDVVVDSCIASLLS